MARQVSKHIKLISQSSYNWRTWLLKFCCLLENFKWQGWSQILMASQLYGYPSCKSQCNRKLRWQGQKKILVTVSANHICTGFLLRGDCSVSYWNRNYILKHFLSCFLPALQVECIVTSTGKRVNFQVEAKALYRYKPSWQLFINN